jgi:hypothetical protein
MSSRDSRPLGRLSSLRNEQVRSEGSALRAVEDLSRQ